MIITVPVKFKGNTVCQFTFDEIIECPMCKHAIKPVILDNCSIKNDSNNTYKVAFFNLCVACNSTYIVQYDGVVLQKITNSNNYNFIDGTLSYIAPNTFIPQIFNDFISKTSPNFIKIFNQASSAELLNLDEISGIGYRKALEFLIKDYLIYAHTDKKDIIEKLALGACINNYIDNPQLKTAASRAVWLGNDQTHYIQKFTDKDINDLKLLIRVTVYWISMILETEQAATLENIK